MWKTWKRPGILQLSGKNHGICKMLGESQGKLSIAYFKFGVKSVFNRL